MKTMRWFVLMLAVAATARGEVSSNAVNAVAAARAACAELGTALRGRLQGAVETNGFTAALAICRDAAPKLAAEISARRGVVVRRTAVRVRNPDNRPDAWERGVLQQFADRVAAGAEAAKLEQAGLATGADGTRVVRYMKAIPMEPLCVTCHGAPIAPDIAAELARLYPQDQATNFVPGEVRGAFSVTMPAP